MPGAVARSETYIAVSPERVFEILSDPESYSEWVVGAQEIREADDDWPEPGSNLHHTVGAGPLRARDATTVEDASPPWMLRLRARAGSLGTAIVTLELRPEARGTRVTMTEEPVDVRLPGLVRPAIEAVTRARNARTLERLKQLAEGGVAS